MRRLPENSKLLLKGDDVMRPELLEGQLANERDDVELNHFPVPSLRAEGERRLDVVAEPATEELLDGLPGWVAEHPTCDGGDLGGRGVLSVALGAPNREGPSLPPPGSRVAAELHDDLPRTRRAPVNPGHEVPFPCRGVPFVVSSCRSVRQQMGNNSGSFALLYHSHEGISRSNRPYPHGESNPGYHLERVVS